MGHTVGAALLLCRNRVLDHRRRPDVVFQSDLSGADAGDRDPSEGGGTSIVGFGVPCSVTPRTSGILENDLNGPFAVQEMAAYDPMIPEAYYTR